jgi:hypothetical protein
MTFTWIIDEFMERREDFLQHTVLMTDAVQQLGLNLIRTPYVPFSEETKLELPDPGMRAICYGTIGLLRQIRKKYPNLRPGGFYESPRFSVTYSSVAYGRYMLNSHTRLDDVDSFPLSQIREVLPGLIAKHGPLFVRPNGVGKAFSGTVVGGSYSLESFLGYLEAMLDGPKGIGGRVELDESFMVRKPVKIKGEYRFVCARNEIIAGSQYRWENRLDIRSDIHPMAQVFAQRMVNEFEGPDRVYVMDIAVSEEDHWGYVVEFNNFSNSGLYACDRLKVVQRVTEICQWDQDHV